MKKQVILRDLLVSCVLYMGICGLWKWLEIFFYGEIQPSIPDDIIRAILSYLLYKVVKNSFKESGKND